jgi:hypothetical protein
MTLAEYDNLDDTERHSRFDTDAKWRAERHEGEFIYNLFKLYDFYVETKRCQQDFIRQSIYTLTPNQVKRRYPFFLPPMV